MGLEKRSVQPKSSTTWIRAFYIQTLEDSARIRKVTAQHDNLTQYAETHHHSKT